jgi:hypothetical protein
MSDRARGIETMHIEQWMDAIYEVYVHNFSDDACPNQSGVQLYVRVEDTEKHLPIFPAPTRELGRCWFVCRIDGVTREIQRVNRVLADVPRVGVETK